MAYVFPNFETKDELAKALLSGWDVGVFSPGFGIIPENGTVLIEGPQYTDKRNRWFATGTMKNGKLVNVT